MNKELITDPAAKPTVLLTKNRENRVYIAGPMTGLPGFNFPAFNTMAATMRAEGWHVENPAEHGHVEGAEWADYLRHDIGRMATCEAVMLLPGWSKSRGAQLELHIAEELGLRIMLAEGAEPAAQHQGEPAAIKCWSYKMGGEQRFYPSDPRQYDWGVSMAEFITDVEPLYAHPPTS
ncbi:DUF4406 domain-containing protein, partial [Pseudomonas sp. GD03860]